MGVRVVFDNNVVVSALVHSRALSWLRNAWAVRSLTPIVCQETVQELVRVLAYPKFRLAPAERVGLLEYYLPYAEAIALPSSLPTPPIACRDPDDAVFLALAIVAQTLLVTGDKDLLALRDTAPIEILTVAELRHRV